MTYSRLSRSSAGLASWLLSALVAVLLLGLWAAAPPAAAADGDSHLEMTMVLHDDETADLHLVLMVEGTTRSDLEDSDSGCNANNFEEIADASSEAVFEITELKGEHACDIRAPGLTLARVENLFDDDMTVVHSDGTYKVVLDGSFFSRIDEPKLTLEFPGKVESASSGGSIDGNTVVWEKPSSSDELQAVGADSSGPPLLLILLGVVVVLIVVAGIVSLVLVRRRQAGTAGQPQYPGYAPPSVPGVPVGGQPGQPQPGYVASGAGQAVQPGQPYPGYTAQPQGQPQGAWAAGQPGQGQVPPTAPYVAGQTAPPAAPYSPGPEQTPGVAQPPAYPGQVPGVYPSQGPGAQW